MRIFWKILWIQSIKKERELKILGKERINEIKILKEEVWAMRINY